MKDKPVSDYWLSVAMEQFINDVWQGGLKKFAEDTVGETATLCYGPLSITVSSGADEKLRFIELGDTITHVIICLNLDEEIPEVELIDKTPGENTTSLVEDIVDIWKESYFKLKEE